MVTAETLLNYKKNDAFGQWLQEIRQGLREGNYKIKRHYNAFGYRPTVVEIWGNDVK